MFETTKFVPMTDAEVDAAVKHDVEIWEKAKLERQLAAKRRNRFMPRQKRWKFEGARRR